MDDGGSDLYDKLFMSSSYKLTKSEATSSPSCSPKLSPPSPSLTQLPAVGQAQRRNPTSSTEIVGHIHTSSSQSDATSSPGEGGSRDFHSNVVALCTLDGTWNCIIGSLLSLYKIIKNKRYNSTVQMV